ncbi:MAG: amidohydrolase [Proteobacteria bacterium]|nr:amidohydrolase [Pseudomonadota bacterium]
MLILSLLLSCAPTGSQVAETPPAPLLAFVGHIGDDKSAVLVRGDRIEKVVAADDPLVGSADHVVKSDRITAGFVDAHAHPMGLGRTLATLDLAGIQTYAGTLERIRSWKGDGWVTGRGWDQNDWADAPSGGWPLAADLERVAPGKKVALRRVDGHAVWVSPAVLADAGITKDTADPEGGRILRDDAGAPTGVLVDTAMGLVEVPKWGDDQAEAALRDALDAIAAAGLTGVHDMGVGDQSLALYTKLDEKGELKVRIWAYLHPDSEAAKRLLDEGPWRGDKFSVVGIKAYADGALGSRGALLSAPYSDEPGHSGLAVTPAAELAELSASCLKAEAQLAVHAIGDLAVTQVLDGFEAARAAHPDAKALLRVEHAQIVNPKDRERFAGLNVVASMQPTHATSDMPWAEERLGPDRVGWAYTWRSLQQEGALVAFGSDFPVESVSPALGMWAATTRTDAHGMPEGGWTPDELLTRDEAVQAFTLGAARAVQEAELGALEAGFRADLTLWREDRIQAGRWIPAATVVDGDIVWREAN